jgi:coenzyme PQQ precursor peptide PqqA
LSSKAGRDRRTPTGFGLLRANLNPLNRLWFDQRPHNPVNFFCIATLNSWQKISLANFSFPTSLTGRAEFVPFTRRAKMDWKTPRIVEVPVGMEINMYACAARK